MIEDSKNTVLSAQEIKNQRIAASRKLTAERRLFSSPKTFELKIIENKLTPSQQESLHLMFLEAKWLYNSMIEFIGDNNIDNYDTKVKSVSVCLGKDSDNYDNRELNNLPASTKQQIHQGIKDSMKGLKTLKNNGRKTGSLGFIQERNSIPLRQCGRDFSIINDYKMKITKLGILRVRGLKQFSQDADIANAQLVKKPSGFFIKVVVYVPICDVFDWGTLPDIGIDFGIKEGVTTSKGETFSTTFPVSFRLKNLQRKLSRQKKGSVNYVKTLEKIRIENEKISNKKDDYAKKLAHYLLNNHHFIYMQDENISGWKSGLFGKQVHKSFLGRLKSILVNHPRVFVLRRSAPTTQFCPKCYTLNKHSMDKRIYNCPCGYSCDRDIHAARNMIIMGQNEDFVKKNVAVECGNLSLVERNTSAKTGDTMLSVDVSDCENLGCLSPGQKQETSPFRVR